MLLTQLLQISAVAILACVPSTVAKLHSSCTCHNQDSYNWRITTAACTAYKNQYGANYGAVHYDTPSGRCDVDGNADHIDGDNWEKICQSTAKAGFQCARGEGTCYVSDTSKVQGWCK